MNERSRRIAIGAGAILALLLLVLILVPFLFRDRIEERARAGIERSVDAEVAWDDLGLGLLSTFPHPSVRFEGLTVTGVDAFAGDTLASIGGLRVVVDLGSVWRNVRRGEPIVVRSVDVDDPVVRLRRLEDGRANWDIAREEPPEPEAEPDRALEVELRRFTVRDGVLTLRDRETGLVVALGGVEQSLRGDFSREVFDLRTRLQADQATVRFAGMPYLERARLELAADVEADTEAGRFVLGDNELRVNDLPLAFTGVIERRGGAGGDGAEPGAADGAAAPAPLHLDLAFETPQSEFRHLLSLVPALYARDFESLETDGTMAVNGRVQGTYAEDAFPAFALEATVRDGRFRYPDRDLPARDIQMDLSVENPGGDLDRTVVTLSRLHAVIGDDPIDASLVLRTPVSDPDVDLEVAGTLDLADLERTVKLEDIEALSGVLVADAAMRARLSALEAGRYEAVSARGGVDARNVTVRGEAVPHPVAIEEAALRLSPEHAEITTFRGQVGSSDLRLAGFLDNLLGFALREEELRGRMTLDSRRIDLDEWRSDDPELDVIPVPGNVDFALQVSVDSLGYGDLTLTDVRGGLRMEDRRLSIEDLRAGILGGGLGIRGFYETTDVTRPAFEVDLELDRLDIPAAFETLATVRALAPVARYASGTFSTRLGLSGALREDMLPRFETLRGEGTLQTSALTLQGFPPLERVAETLSLPRLQNPTLRPIDASIEIQGGRLHARPFTVQLDDLSMTVGGSNGVDGSLQYALRLEVPRAILGSEAERAVSELLERAGRAGDVLDAADLVQVGVQLTGTVEDPTVRADVGGILDGGEAVEEAAGEAAREAGEALREEAERRLEDVEREGEEAREAVSERARAEADEVLRAAEARAAEVREEARRLSESVRQEGYARADSLVEGAEDPVAQAAARLAADRLRREADAQAERILEEANEEAARILRRAEARADSIAARDTL